MPYWLQPRLNDAIEYYHQFRNIQAHCKSTDENFIPLNVACVFSPVQTMAGESDSKNVADIKQLQEDLPQEKMDNPLPQMKRNLL